MRTLLITLAIALLTGCPPSDPKNAEAHKDSAAEPPPPPPPPLAEASPGSVGVVLVFDVSGSMSGQKLSDVKAVAGGEIASQFDVFSLSKRLDVAVVLCGGYGESVAIPLSGYESRGFKAVIQGLRTGGTTPLDEALRAARTALAKTKAETKHLFVLSDGAADNDVTATVLELVKGGLAGSNMHVIGFQTDEQNYTPFKDVGAKILMVEDKPALETAMSETFKVILQLEADDPPEASDAPPSPEPSVNAAPTVPPGK